MSVRKAPRIRDPFDGVTAVNEGFEAITAVNDNPIPREALPTDAIEPVMFIEPVGRAEPVPVAEPTPAPSSRAGIVSVSDAVPIRVTDADSGLATTTMAPLTRSPARLAPLPPSPPQPAASSEPHGSSFSYPRYPRSSPWWHYLVLGAAVAALVVVALSVLSSLGFAPLQHH